jgi:hypothetical protein
MKEETPVFYNYDP